MVLGEERVFVPVQLVENDEAAGKIGGCLHGIRQSPGKIGLHDEPVDDDLNVVLFVLVERNILRQLVQTPVDAHAGVAAAPGILEDLLVLALFAAHDGG